MRPGERAYEHMTDEEKYSFISMPFQITSQFHPEVK